ncbi:hypothetical protein WMY93_001180 [Mugilogobius chulae]|uniref:DNA helicase n=1 Tax=Mugilogobius chulae TaxID=88201 RepID=A0AAW0Q4M1_9GOBI
MADPGMLSLFGDDAGLFSDGFDGLGDSFPQQTASAQTNAPMNHDHQGNRPYHQGMMAPASGQPKMGQMYDHGSYGGYDQSGAAPGRMMAQNGPSQGPTNVNPAMNGMASHYHNNPANSTNPHHGAEQVALPTAPSQGAPNQMGGYQMPQGNYSGMQGPPGANAARMNQHYSSPSMAPASAQDPAHYLGHVGMSGPQMRHPHTPQQQGQGYPNMGHTPRYPLSPSRQPPHPHPHPQQGMGGYPGGQYPGYQGGQYGAMGPGMNQGANANVGPNAQALGQRFPQGTGPGTGQQGQRYPPGAPHQPHPAAMQQAGQQGQPMHPLNHTQNQGQSHLAPPAQGSYPSPSSLSPMRGMGTPTPPPQGRPPSAGLVGPSEVSGYNSMQSPPHGMSHQQRPPQAPISATHPQHQQPHLPPSAGQMYPGIGPQHGAPLGPNRHPIPPQQAFPTDPSGEGSVMLPDRSTASGQNISTEQPSEQETKPKKKKKKKAKALTTEDDEEAKNTSMEGGDEDMKSEFPATGNDTGELGTVEEISPPQEDKKKRKKKPKDKAEGAEGKEPKEPKTPKAPKAPKTPRPPKNRKSQGEEGESGNAQGQDAQEAQKRRSCRQVKRKRYTEDLEFKISDDGDSGDDSPAPKSPSSSSQQQDFAEAEGPVVEKIMSLRTSKKQLESGEEVEVEEFYVKFKGFSYLHCRWADLEELEKDKRILQKVKRFRAKQQLNNFITEMDDEPFNPDYVEVDRVLDVSESTDENGELVTLYLVKWCSLPYEDSTWELKADIDQSKIEEYEQIAARTPNTKRVDRPHAADWPKLEGSRDYRNGNALREYQLEGLNWLTFNWYNSRNCILADEMGLGKTIQSITFLYEIYMKGIQGPFLVIAPLSTIPNWEREFRTWTELNAIVYHGSQASRKTIQAYEMYYRDAQGKVIKGAYRFHAVITTFEMILADCPELRNIPWRCVVIDEAHRLKNRNCKLLEGLKMMDMEHKVLLTGTPLQNTVEELFSLLNFLEPERFPSEQTFMTEFGDLKTEEQVQKLQGILKPMMLRRLKEDVEKNLAPKEETIIEVELTNIQKKYYRAILEKNFSFLSKGGGAGGSGSGGGGGSGNVPNLLNTMMELRKCCNHPYLINGAEEKIAEEFRETHSADMPEMALQAMIQAAGKLVLIDKLLPKLKAGGHRVLIFSQMVRCLTSGGLPHPETTGFGSICVPAVHRAGGLGINLTAADTCIIFDSDWNPQNDLQAQARCHRIGQSKAVKIYRLITRNSYEREMFDKASLKLGLDKAVLQSMSGRENANSGVQQLSKKEIEDLLRKGAYGALMDEEDEGSKFCEEDIDQILQRRTHTITIESEGKGSTFAKASFVATGNRTDISLEDPDFWQKWAKKAELDLDAINGRQTHFQTSEAQDKTQGYPRSECFRVEKNLLVYGWGRWSDILSHGRFKRPLQVSDVETICRALLAYCLLHYRGDENIKSFIWDLITPSEDGSTKTLTNHSGLSTPVPRGRKGKKGKLPAPATQMPRAEWLASCNPDHLLQEDSYKRHLKHHCNKVLLRVRMLYYLRQEVIGDLAERILEGADSSELDIWIPQPLHAEVPADWWDMEADKSLLIGVFKHGYEKYNSMRADPALCFLERVGMPDAKAIAASKSGENGQVIASGSGAPGPNEKLYWPAASALTARLRRLITEALNRPDGRRRRRRDFMPTISMVTDAGGGATAFLPDGATVFMADGNAYLAKGGTAYFTKATSFLQDATPVLTASPLMPDGAMFYERRQRWTRREEADFYRVVSTFGVVFDTDKQKLDKKTDDSLEKYYYAFIAMCKRVCRMKNDTELPDPSLIIDPITEERASRTLYRIELLRRIREQVLPHPLLSERLKLCQPSPDLPEWWECGRHDRDLLLGAAKHGVSRTDYHILNDPSLSFLEAHQRFTGQRGSGFTTAAQGDAAKSVLEGSTGPIFTSAELACAAAAADLSLNLSMDEEKDEVKMESGENVEISSAKTETSETPKQKSKKKSLLNQRLKLNRKLNKWTRQSERRVEQKNFDEESIASLSTTARDETRDGFCPDDLPETSALQALQDRTFAFSFWPKDRVMINRMDNICEAVLKGKWPVNRRHIFDFHGNLLPGHGSSISTPSVATGMEQRRSLAELAMAGLHTGYSGSEDTTLSPQVHEDALGLGVPKQRRRRRRKIEIEAERAAKRRNLMEMVAQLRESHSTTEAQSQAIDLTKGMHHKASPSLAGFSSGLSPSLKAQMDLLQASSTGHRANGSMDLDLPLMMRRRRGRRKNVETLDMMFMGNKRPSGDEAETVKVANVEAASRPITVPDQSPSGRSLASGSLDDEEAAVSNKDLGEWLRQNPSFAMDVPGFTPKTDAELLLSQFSKPKQKRHRCRNPNKIDINTLTGDERVPVVNRRNGRKMGGAMAPPMKELSRWLLENPEFSIAPDWTDIVKQSGFLPEAMFDRLLTGPVVREEGVRRRGRRPKSEIAKAAAAAQVAAAQAAQASLASAATSAGGINPLLLNSLFGGMDLSSLQSLQSLQLAAGLMAFPTADPKQAAAAASMLPLMMPGVGGLPNMAALPNMFSLGGLFGGNLATAATATATSNAAAASATTNGTSEESGDKHEKDESREAAEEEATEDGEPSAKKKKEGDAKPSEDKPAEEAAAQASTTESVADATLNGDAAALLAAAGMSANSLAFNPFLLSTVAPGLLYPSMFLPPGLGGLMPGFPSASTLAELQTAMAGALGGAAGPSDSQSDEKERSEKDAGAEEDELDTTQDSLLEDGVMAAEDEEEDDEEAESPQKDKSD